ncbi:hypothetical protein DUNSADRAFT_540 [Dunaliella salina]|uniref:Uncharacterized protein n=1 Tax=Dunaliella salina TaxID=3046 RepID=A0ABQ7FYT9_DUNSA|nr:hypothetical protein DUNSADRAFT_540 [Dunaliella salina]|eukprot:KAF5827515.1 hypothetical protein DUNSADRAFT_540 [Dunaliella salina]
MLLRNPLNVASLGLFIVMHVLKLLRLSGVQLMLEGVFAYYSLDTKEMMLAKQTVQNDRKGRKQAMKQLEDLKSKEGYQVAKAPMLGKWLGIPGSVEDVDYMVVFGIAIVLNSFIAIILTYLNGSTSSVAVFIGLFGLFMPMHAMFKFEVLQEQEWSVKLVLAVVLALGVLGSHAALAQWGVARHLFDFGLVRAAAGLDVAVNSVGDFLAQRGALSGPYVPIRTDPGHIALTTSVWAGVLATSMVGPALRYAGLLYRATSPPSWASYYLVPNRVNVKVMQLGFAVPLFLVLVQFKPVAALWGLDEHAALLAFLALLTVMAITHVYSFRPLCQAYLDGAVLEWFKHVHSGREFEGKMAAVKTRMLIIKMALGKAAAQLAVPALLSLAGCCVLLTQAWGSGLLPFQHGPWSSGNFGAAGAGEGGAGDKDGGKDGEVEGGIAGQGQLSDLYMFVFRYLTWWASLAWCVSAYCSMTVSRLGLNTMS